MMNQQNYEHIKASFAKRTGVNLPVERPVVRKTTVIAASIVIAFLLATTAVAASGLGSTLITWFDLQQDSEAYDYLNYIENYENLIASCDGKIVHPLAPGTGSMLVGGEDSFRPAADFVLHDPSMSIEEQRGRWDACPAALDLYRQYIAGPEDHALMISALLPCEEKSAGAVGVPVIYLLIYDKAETLPDSYTFIRGELYQFSELEAYYAFEKDGCVFYDVSSLIITDLEKDAAYAVSTDPYESYTQIKADILHETYSYLQENLPNMIMRYEDYRALTENDPLLP